MTAVHLYTRVEFMAGKKKKKKIKSMGSTSKKNGIIKTISKMSDVYIL